jgi:transposase-like protein
MIDPASQPSPSIAQPESPTLPIQQSFKCDKCGATFEDEGSAAAHIQECTGAEVMPLDEGAPKKA